MNVEIRAIYENGVFRPLHPVSLPESRQVTIRICDESEGTRKRGIGEGDQEIDDIEPVWRGVFPVEPKRGTTFNQSVTVRTSELPQLKPTVELNPQWLEENDE